MNISVSYIGICASVFGVGRICGGGGLGEGYFAISTRVDSRVGTNILKFSSFISFFLLYLIMDLLMIIDYSPLLKD